MRNYLRLLIVLLFWGEIDVMAQFELEFVSFEESMTDISASKNAPKDLNWDPTAILRIQIPRLKDISVVGSDKFGEVEYSAGETMVYMLEGAKK